MAQQINLSSGQFKVQPQRFSANTLVAWLGAVLVVGAAMGASWAWQLSKRASLLAQTEAQQAKDIASLRASVEANKALAAPVDPALLQRAQAARELLSLRIQLKQALLDGRFQPGWGHSDRLLLVSRSIPQPVWLTDVKADVSRLEVAGFTLEPAALNQWVERLSDSPLMQGLHLSTVQVENTAKAAPPTPATAPATSVVPATRPQWSFTLVSAQAPPPKATASAPGGKS